MQMSTLHTRRVTRLIFSVALSVITLFAMSKPSSATGNVVPADLAGNWQMTIIGETRMWIRNNPVHIHLECQRGGNQC
jgi:hypothetical protein